MTIEKVYLNKDIDYVFCFLKEEIITEEECDMYEYNLECDEKGDILGRTHRKGSNSGATYAYRGPDPILNDCNYCIEKNKAKAYWLPREAIPLFNKKKSNDGFLKNMFRRGF